MAAELHLLRKAHSARVTTTVQFLPTTALSLMASVIGSRRIGSWCTGIRCKSPADCDEKDWYAVIGCGGILEFQYGDGNTADLDFTNLADGFVAWYEDRGEDKGVMLRLNANYEAYFDPTMILIHHPEELDIIIQYALFGFYKFKEASAT